MRKSPPHVWRSKVFRVGGTMGNRFGWRPAVLATDYQDIALPGGRMDTRLRMSAYLLAVSRAAGA